MDFCGTDVHQKESEICILDEAGEVKEAGRSSQWVSRLINGSEMRSALIEEGGIAQTMSRTTFGGSAVLDTDRSMRLKEKGPLS